MSTEVEVIKKKEIVVNPDDLESIIRTAMISIEKKDYRATVTNIQQNGQIPDAMTAFVDMDDGHKNDYDFNRDLDVKGTISGFQLWQNKLTRVAVAMSQLEDWRFIKREDSNGDMIEVKVDLAQLAADEERWLSLSLGGSQSEKEIRLMRAGFGLNEESTLDKGAKWFGLVKKKKSEVYQQAPQQ
jgi:hypothetical protein